MDPTVDRNRKRNMENPKIAFDTPFLLLFPGQSIKSPGCNKEKNRKDNHIGYISKISGF